MTTRTLWLNIYQLDFDHFESDIAVSEDTANQHPNFLTHLARLGEDTRIGQHPWPIEVRAPNLDAPDEE
jgi:hypothetical protein